MAQLEKYTKLENEYKVMNNDYLEKEDEFFKEQAGIIAEKLEDNKPCPVCGSVEHPKIAQKSLSVLTKQVLDQLKKKLEDKQKEKQKQQEECINTNSHQAICQAAFANFIFLIFLFRNKFKNT